MVEMTGAPFLQRVYVVPDRVPAYEGFPYGLPFVRGLDLAFKRPVTYLVGENGSGKSTIIEAIAEVCGLPVSGGGRNEAAARHGPEQHSALGGATRPAFSRRPRDGYSFRAEFQAHFASLLDEQPDDRPWGGVPSLGEGVPAMARNFAAVVRFAGGRHAVVTQTLAGFEYHLGVAVVGSEGAARGWWSGTLDRTRQAAYELRVRRWSAPGPESVPIGASGELVELEEQLRQVAVAFGERRTLVSAGEARAAVAVCLAAERSLREGREIVLA